MRAFKTFRRFSENVDHNWSMIRREMIADVIQNMLKLTAYHFSQSQAIKAELMRAFLDAVNHGFMFAANRWSKHKPDEKYNYGNS